MNSFFKWRFTQPTPKCTLLFFLVVLCFGAKTSYSSNYYFSSSNGNDEYSSQQAQNPYTPWQSLSKLNETLKKLKSGDGIYFKRGDIFEGSIIINSSGKDEPLIFGAYGDGNKPVIGGLKLLYGWKFVSNGIYETDWAIEGTQLIINNKQQALGRYPNKGYLNYQSLSNFENSFITDFKLNSSTNWTNAEVVIRKNRWIIDKSKIKSHVGNTINYEKGKSANPSNGYGYFIQKSKQTLDQVGEWFFDSSRKKMMVYFGSEQPYNFVVRFSVIDNLINIKNHGNITFENLAFIGAGENAIEISNSKNVSIRNCTIDFTGQEAIVATHSANVKIENVWIDRSLSGGINLDHGCTNSLVYNNTIKRTGLIPGLGNNGPGTYEAITSFADYTQIEKNVIDSSGHNGIYFGGNGSVVKNNVIQYFCLTKDDGAGVYVGDWSKTYNKNIIGNIILNGLGNGDGTDNPEIRQAEGIYVDDLSQSVNIENNTIAKCAHNGIKIHNAKDINVFDNVVFDNGIQISLEQDHYNPTSTYIRNNNIKNNTFFSKDENQTVARITSHQDDITAFGEFDSNAYCRPLDEAAIIHTINTKNWTVAHNEFDLPSWKAAYGKDWSSKKSPKAIPKFTLNKILGENKFPNAGFDSNIYGLYSHSSTNDCSTTYNYGVLDGGGLKLAFNSPVNNNVIVNFNVGRVVAGKNYVLRFSMLGNTQAKNAQVYLRRAWDPYTPLSDKELCNFKYSRTENEFIFTALADDDYASVIFEINQPSGQIYLDNIALYEADVNKININDHVLFDYNANDYIKTIELNKPYMDVNSRVYKNSITLQPYTSIVLMAAEPIIEKKYKPNLSAHLMRAEMGIDGLRIKVADYELRAFPNPFQSQLTLEFTAPTAGNGMLMLYDVSGKMISEIYKGYMNADESKSFSVNVGAMNLTTGMYIVRLVTDKKTFSQKVMYVK